MRFDPCNPCETHFNVGAPGCPICLLIERDRYRAALERIARFGDDDLWASDEAVRALKRAAGDERKAA